MNREIRSSLIGMVYGDGCISVASSAYIRVYHCAKQEEYIRFKAQYLSESLKIPIRVIPYSNHGYPAFKFEKSHKYFRFLRKCLYPNNVKTFDRRYLNWLTPRGIAFWYMDDGSLSAKRRRGRVHAHELSLSTYVSYEQNQIIIDFFKEVYGIRFSQRRNKGWYTLRCATKEARKFCDLVRKYIHSSMEYKVIFKAPDTLT